MIVAEPAKQRQPVRPLVPGIAEDCNLSWKEGALPRRKSRGRKARLLYAEPDEQKDPSCATLPPCRFAPP
ncbi:hypothetical protein DD559_17260 [Sphingomonas pokkalii]|uniref:Uncharacterized protein n=1 Tax=Sphingomonas pokkalii TaxID=2175090 RepID=A0A2U0SHN4_9SPHN|nr:hypothetical protein DD559_17260 [Sphingomonas pokkalii]